MSPTGNVTMVLPDPFPPDVRVQKEATTLRAAGHTVRICCPAEPDRPREETVEGITVSRVAVDETGIERLARNLYVGVTANRPEWAAALRDRADWTDVFHVHDLQLAGTTLRVGRATDTPVVVDCHENYPEALRQWRRTDSPWARPLERLAFPIRRYKRLERRWTKRAAHVLTVAREARDHYVHDCLVPPTAVTVVGNTVDLDRFDPTTDPAVDDGFTVAYVGSFGVHRGLATAVRAVARLPAARLVLVGDDDCTTGDRLRRIAADRGVEDRVTFVGRVPFDDVPGWLAAADVCLVPHAATPHTETTLPHKLFQYMAMATPVVVTDVAPLARVVGETGAGRVVPAGDPAAMADALRELCEDPDERERLGAAGRRAVERRYNWGRDGARLRAVYERVLSDGTNRATSG